LLAGFYLGPPTRRLVVAGRTCLPKSRRYLYRTAAYWPLRVDPRIHTAPGVVPDDRVQVYLKAADALLIPRSGVLNSGNVALGFTFGLPVVGPHEGVVGEVLRATGNPTFDATSAWSFSKAISAALASPGLGEANLAYAREHMQWPTIAKAHVAWIKQLQRDRQRATG